MRSLGRIASMRKAYQSDLSDAEWSSLEPHLPAPEAIGRPRLHTLREILDAIFYIVRGGCAWGAYFPMTSHPGRPSTTTSVSGAWMEPGRGCIQSPTRTGASSPQEESSA